MSFPPLGVFIDSIEASALAHPLYDHTANPVQVYFSLKDFSAWITTPNPKTIPIAVSQDVTFNVALTAPTLAALAAMQPPISLNARLDQWEVFSASGITDPKTGFAKLAIQAPATGTVKRALPWAIMDHLTWTLTAKVNNADVVVSCSTLLEIYVLPKLPPRFEASGIPLALLRDRNYLPAWMDPNQAIVDWPNFATQALFNDTRLEFQTWNGTCKYTSWAQSRLKAVFADQQGPHCWLDLWLTDLQDAGPGKPRRPVNSYDISVLHQVLVSLGVDATATQVRLKYVQPFGFINRTQLLGRAENPTSTSNPKNECNNPLYGDVFYMKGMICDVDEPKRSALRDHMFLTFQEDGKELVYDACIGPHLGTTGEPQYLTAVLDAREVRYKPEFNPTHYGLGRIEDIADGDASGFVSSSCFDQGGSSNSTVINNLASAMEKFGTWSLPAIHAPAGEWGLTATWTLHPTSDSDELITVNVFRYLSFWQSVSTWDRRTADIPRWIPSGSSMTDGQADTASGSIRMFYDSSRCYLATIEARKGTAATTYNIRNTLQGILDTAFPMTVKPTRYIKSIDAVAPSKIGDSIKVTVKVWVNLDYLT